ncbi:MAG: anaerobic ribonucleoside-triphosphate reductase activating protein [Eubacteriales bacterium]|nr:anaerobic ribonucleoside-triphosphate reductase activating protein [Eubacteriales bacterium]
MQIAGYLKQSLVDYPGTLAAVIFTPGCNFDCYYCHNRHILGAQPPAVPMEDVWAHLRKRAGLLEAVVISGGEPCLQRGLPQLLREIRALGYRTKLDTNGAFPGVVRALLDEGLLDYVAVDIKAPWEKYRQICRADGDAVRETLDILRQSGVDWEARTTFVPELTVEDIERIARDNAPLPAYAVQAYRPPDTFRADDAARVARAPHSAAVLAEAVRRAQVYCPRVLLRD